MNELEQKNARRNMILFFIGLTIAGSLAGLFATGFLSGFSFSNSVVVTCNGETTVDLLKNSLLNSNPQLKNASLKVSGITTLSTKPKQVDCRSTVNIENNEYKLNQEIIVDYGATLSDDNKVINLIIQKIIQTKLNVDN